MSVPERRAKLDRDHPGLSIRRQRALLGIVRSGVCRRPRPANDNELALIRRIDELAGRFWARAGWRRCCRLVASR